MRTKKIAVTVLLILSCAYLNAQSSAAAISQTMQTIYRNYDSLNYLSFDVKFNYGSDTLLGKFDNEQMDGTYTLAGKKARYRLGDVDFMQNDSFFIAVYNKDKMMMVDAPRMLNTGSQLPLRSQIDSLLTAYSQHYNMSMTSLNADTSMILFTAADTLAQFSVFSIVYDNNSKLIYQVRYEYNEPAELDAGAMAQLMAAPGNNGQVPKQKKRFMISFLNYRFDNYDDSVYDESVFFWFDNGQCRPAVKYDTYRIYYQKPATKFTEVIE